MKTWKKIVLAVVGFLVVLLIAAGVGLWYLGRQADNPYRKMDRPQLMAAIAKAPSDPEPHEYLGRFLGNEANYCKSREQQSALYRESYAEYRKANELSADDARRYLLVDLGWAAYRAGDKAAAGKYARTMAMDESDDWNHGNAINHGHTILGLLALDRGDIKTAKAELAAAGATPGSPQLNSFGPQMSLAKALLEKGEKEAVIAYFAACGKFWKMSFGKLGKWTEMAKAGKVPDFGANLYY